VILIPKVYPGLIANLDLARKPGEGVQACPDRCVLGLPAQILGVEIRNVVVSDAFLGGASGAQVPDRLGHTTSCQVPIRQAQLESPVQGINKNWALAE
jgi:hypothetical protein